MTKKGYALAGMAAPSLFLLTYLLMSFLRPEYDLYTKAVSELGSLDAPNKWFWNIFGYILPGVLLSIFSIGLHKAISPSGKYKLPLVGIFLSGALMALSGVFPGDFEERTSLTMLLHTIGSVGSYLGFLVGAFTYPSAMAKSVYWRGAIRPTLLFTWLTILFGGWPFLFPEFPAVGQRIVFLFYFMWIAFMAYKLARQRH